MITCYAEPSKKKSQLVLEAFSCGAGGKMASTTARELEPGPAAFYGVRPAWAHLWEQAKREGRDAFYLDNSWFDASREAYFRVGYKALQSWSPARSNGKRLAALGVKVEPWRRNGEHIVVCPQSDEFMKTMGGCAGGATVWRAQVSVELAKHTDRLVVIRDKGSGIPLAEALRDAWLLVAHSSVAAVEALIAGVPVIVTGKDCAASGFSTAFEDVESPRRQGGRRDWAERLADSQWSMSEMKDGTCWRELQRLG